MPIPGLGHPPSQLVAALSGSATTSVLHTALGSPTAAVRYWAFFSSGVMGSATTSSPALDAETGMNPASIGVWYFSAPTIGVGGDAGDGGGDTIFNNEAGGGGGGGAGYIAGAGGTGWTPAANGASGGVWPTTTGGTAAATAVLISPPAGTAGTAGSDGGDAIRLNHSVTIYLTSTIGGGGGGGAGGVDLFSGSDAGDGGDLGVAGVANGVLAGGAAGYAIRFSGSGAATIIGGTVLGTVG